MSRFEGIDEKIEQLATKLGAKLTKDRPEYPEVLRTFEERRINWMDGDIFKAIIIQPTFESKGVNQKIWNFINFAWMDFNDEGFRPQWMKFLVKQKPFEIIKTNIDSLLMESEKNMISVSKEDLE